jgi:hypothetical protein
VQETLMESTSVELFDSLFITCKEAQPKDPPLSTKKHIEYSLICTSKKEPNKVNQTRLLPFQILP